MRWSAKVREEGRAEARVEERRRLLRKQLVLRFGPLSPEFDMRIAEATAEELDRYVERILVRARRRPCSRPDSDLAT